MTGRWQVRAFGYDCFGNITGYCVERHTRNGFEVANRFVGDIYKPGSHAEAKSKAETLCNLLNE